MSITNGRYTVDLASMLGTGNFVLYNKSVVTWESFENLSDTLLGGQNQTAPSRLVSDVSSKNRSTRNFFLGMQYDGNVVTYVENFSFVDDDYRTAYWAFGNSRSEFVVLNINNRGLMCLYSQKSSVLILANRSHFGNKRYFTIYRSTLDPDGVFSMYSYHFGSGINLSEKLEWQNLEDQCQVKGYCGLNSYCSRSGDNSDCYCYPGFALINENKKFCGCSQNLIEDDCVDSKYQVMHHNITILENMQWEDDPYYVIPMKRDGVKCLARKIVTMD